jgi:hypothetical protein
MLRDLVRRHPLRLDYERRSWYWCGYCNISAVRVLRCYRRALSRRQSKHPVTALSSWAFLVVFLLRLSSAGAQTYSLTELGSLGGTGPSHGAAVNASGQVTGYGFTSGNAAYHAFAPYVTLTYAKAITDSGFVLALGKDSRTRTAVWLLLQAIPPSLSATASSVMSGASPTISVAVRGNGPFSYQWYQGVSGDTSVPMAGATGSSFSTPPLSTTTSFWVQVNTPVGIENSAAITITVTGAASGDGPIPLWALVALAAGLVVSAQRRLRQT